MTTRSTWLFDIDGTLVLTGGAGHYGMCDAFEQVFGVNPDLDGLSFAGRTDRAIIRDFFARHAIEDSDENWQKFLGCYAEILPAYLAKLEGCVLAGVFDLIDQLRQRSDDRLGLLTGNIKLAAEQKLRYYELWEHFEFGAYGDEHADRDDVARTALQQIRDFQPAVDPENIWVVGDTPNDIKCARAIGARVVAVATGSFSTEELAEHDPDLLLSDLSDVDHLLEHADGG